MGVDRTDYIVLGANVGKEYCYKNEWWDDEDSIYAKCRNGHYSTEFRIIADNYSNEYMVVGKVIQKANGYMEGINLIEIGQPSAEESEKVKQFILKHFGVEVEPKIIVFTNWH